MARLSEARIAGEALEKAGVPYTVHQGRKHNKVKWEIAGKAFSYACAKSASDWRAGENCRCAIRRILRAAGVDA